MVSKVRLGKAESRLQEAIRGFISRRRQRVGMQSQRFRLLSPLASLDRGWALVRSKSGSIVRQVTDVAAGDELTILMRDGTLAVQVTTPPNEDRKPEDT
mgnify:CR=1 FL=1